MANEQYGSEGHVAPRCNIWNTHTHGRTAGQTDWGAALEAAEKGLQGGNGAGGESRSSEHRDGQESKRAGRDQHPEEPAAAAETPVAKTKQNGPIEEGWRRESEKVSFPSLTLWSLLLWPEVKQLNEKKANVFYFI